MELLGAALGALFLLSVGACCGFLSATLILRRNVLIDMGKQRGKLIRNVTVEIDQGDTLANAPTIYVGDRLFVSIERFSEAMDAAHGIQSGDRKTTTLAS